MTQKVIYLHGYGSSGNTDTAKNLSTILGNGFSLESPTYNYSSPRAAAAELEALVERLSAESPILVGTSLGGFFANYLSRVFDKRAVIVNPSLSPSTSLHKYGETAATLIEYRRLELKELRQKAQPAKIVVLGLRDSVIDHNLNGRLLKDVAELVTVNMGHRIEPAFYEVIGGLVRKLCAENSAQRR